MRRNGIGGAIWSGAKAGARHGYYSYRAGRLEEKAKRFREKARGNPSSGRIPGKALEIRYLRSDGKRYFHPFEHHVRMIANRNGSVTLRGSRRVWADDGEAGFWERYGHHGRHGAMRNARKRSIPRHRRRYSSGGNNLLLYAGLALLLYPLLTRSAQAAVSTGGQEIIPQPGASVWYSDPYQGGDGSYFTGSLPPGAAPPWRLASATEIGGMTAGLVSGYLADMGGGLVASAPGFLT